MGVMNMRDVVIAHMVKQKGSGAPLLGKIKMEGVLQLSGQDVAKQVYDASYNRGGAMLDIEHLLVDFEPTITVTSNLQKRYMIEAEHITNEHINIQEKIITIPIEAFNGKAFLGYTDDEMPGYSYMMLFQSHTDKTKVHALSLVGVMDSSQFDLAVRGRFTYKSLQEWQIRLPQELGKYIQAHIDSQRDSTTYNKIQGVHKGYNIVGGGGNWMNTISNITIKRTGKGVNPAGKGVKHLY